MLPRVIKFAYAVIMIAAVALSFIVTRNIDESTTQGHSETLTVSRIHGDTDSSQAAKAVVDFSRARHVNVGHLYYDPLDNGTRRIYLAVGDPRAESTRWLTAGYPQFSRTAKIDVRPYDELAAQEADGIYFVYGPQPLTSELGEQFQRLGYQAFIEPNFSVLEAIQDAGNRATLWCLLVVGLVIVVAVASGVALNAKSYGVQRLQGQPATVIMWRDLRQLAPFAGVIALLVAGTAVALLIAYNRLHQFNQFACIALSIVAVYALTALFVHVVTLAMVNRSSIVSAIKGEVTGNWPVVGAYVLRCWSVLLVFSIGTSAIASTMQFQRERTIYDMWTAMGNAYYMRLSGAVANPDGGQFAMSRIGQWIRGADGRNEVSIASRQGVPGTALEMLVVNNSYLERHALYDPDGARVQPAKDPAVRVLLPSRYGAESTQIGAGVAKWAETQDSTAHGKTLPPMTMEATRDGQSLMFYTVAAGHEVPVLHDPIVVVMTAASGIITDYQYAVMGTNDEVLVEDPARALKGLAAVGVARYVLGMSPFAGAAAERLRAARRDLAVQSFNILAALAVLLATAVSVSLSYVRLNSQTLFVKYISGWTFLRTHWAILAAESAVGLSLVMWTWYETYAVLERQRIPGAPPVGMDDLFLGGWQPAVAGGVALAGLAMVVVTLARVNGRFVRANSTALS